MREISPGKENEWASQDIAERNNIGTHAVVPGIVNVEHNNALSDCRVLDATGTLNPEYTAMHGGAAP